MGVWWVLVAEWSGGVVEWSGWVGGVVVVCVCEGSQRWRGVAGEREEGGMEEWKEGGDRL